MTEPACGDVNRYARLDPIARALVDDHDQIALAAMLVKAHDDLERARQELADRTEAESADAAAGSYAGRVQEVEQQRDEARETNRRLNLRTQQLESELTAYRRAISTWEFTERGTYVPLRSITAMAKAAGVGYDGTRYELHYERVERVEAQLAAVADLIADHEGDEWAAHPATTALRGILDSEEYAIAQPEPWLHITFTSPDETTANTSALSLRDHLAAEFPGVGMRISSNAVEGDEPEHICKPGASTYFCSTSGEMESDCHSGFDQCCDRPDLHRPGPAATEATNLGNKPDAPAWTPPPPGSTAEQLPDHLLALIRDRLPDYTSTACQTADALACAACYPGSGIPRPQYDEIREHAERLHERCRLNMKFTGQICRCFCHEATDGEGHASGVPGA